MANGFNLETVGRALSGLSAGIQGRGLEFAQGLQQQEESRLENEKLLSTERKQAQFFDVRNGLNLLNSGQVDQFIKSGSERVLAIEELGGDPTDTLTILSMVRQGDIDGARLRLSTEDQRGVTEGFLPDIQKAGSGGLASAKTEILSDGSTVQVLPNSTTQVTDPQGNVVTGQERLDVLARSQEFNLDQLGAKSEIAVREARGKAEATQRASRVSQITTELSTRNRNASRESIKLNQALNLAGTAEQGLSGSAKLKLAKLFPSIDVTNEAMLAQSLKGLALDQLQNFKGPTTDFEFGVTEDIAGKLGDSRSANIARIKSLNRASWFNKREFTQFQQHVKEGKSPDTFGFNFNEQIKTKRGSFSLQDIQDTAVENNLSIENTLKRLNK